MKRIKYFIPFIVMIMFLNCSIAVAKTTPNGIQIIENEENSFRLTCYYYDGSIIYFSRPVASETGTTGGNKTYSLPDLKNETLRNYKFMDANGNLDCPKVIIIDESANNQIIGFDDEFVGTLGGIHGLNLNTSESKCEGICENILSYTSTNDENNANNTNNGFEIGTLDCKGIFKGEFGKILKQILDILRFLVPILIIGLSVVDFIKALAAQNQDELKKASQKFIKRLIIGIIIFLLPTILEFVLNLAGIEYGVCPIGE